MFGVVPKPLWQKLSPCDGQNRIPMGCQSLLLRRGARNILIDAGLGQKLSPKLRKIYALDENPPTPLEAALKEIGLDRQAITDVVLTHLHFDHAGGLTRYDESGQNLLPTFPNARHWVQAPHLDWARGEAAHGGSFPAENIEPLVQRGLFSLTRGEEELFRGLLVIPLNGHTKCMQALLLEGERPIFFPSDLIPTAAHLRIPYIMAYDVDPLTTAREKERMLARAAEGDWLVFLQHEPMITYGPLERFHGHYSLGKP